MHAKTTSMILIILLGCSVISNAQLNLGLGLGLGVGIGPGLSLNTALGANISLKGLGLITASTNVAITAAGAFTVSVTQNAALNKLVLGAVGSTPLLDVKAGVTLTVNGGLNISTGTINVQAGARLVIKGSVGLLVSGSAAININLGVGAVLNVNSINVLRVGVGASLNINGQGTLSLASTVLNAQAGVNINVPVVLGVGTVINTAVSGRYTRIRFNSLINVDGEVNLGADLVLGGGATLIFNSPNSSLSVMSASLLEGSSVVMASDGAITSMLNVAGSLDVAADLSVNIIGEAGVALPVATFGSMTGQFKLADGLTGSPPNGNSMAVMFA